MGETAKKGHSEKDSREFIHPRHSTKDLATRALEELAQRTSGQFEEMEAAQKSSSVAQQKKSNANFKRRVKGPGAVQRVLQLGIPVVAGIAIVGGALMFTSGAFTGKTGTSKKFTWSDVDTLIQQDKSAQALPILESLKKQGKLTKSQTEKMYGVYIAVAKEYAGDKRYNDAIQLLSKIPSKSPQSDQAKQLIRKYKRGR